MIFELIDQFLIEWLYVGGHAKSAVIEMAACSSRDLPKNQRAQHRNGIRRGAVKMSGGFSRRIKA